MTARPVLALLRWFLIPAPALPPMVWRPATSILTLTARAIVLLGVRLLVHTLRHVIWTRALMALLHALWVAPLVQLVPV